MQMFRLRKNRSMYVTCEPTIMRARVNVEWNVEAEHGIMQ
jgi:hypothetical protein